MSKGLPQPRELHILKKSWFMILLSILFSIMFIYRIYGGNNYEKEISFKEMSLITRAVVDMYYNDNELHLKVDNKIVKWSNYYGVEIKGKKYFYRFYPGDSYDPLSRGEIKRDKIKVINEISDGNVTFLIYR